MIGRFRQINNPFTQSKGFYLSKIIKDLGDGVVLGEVDENTLPAHQRVLLSEQKKFDNLFPSIS